MNSCSESKYNLFFICFFHFYFLLSPLLLPIWHVRIIGIFCVWMHQSTQVRCWPYDKQNMLRLIFVHSAHTFHNCPDMCIEDDKHVYHTKLNKIKKLVFLVSARALLTVRGSEKKHNQHACHPFLAKNNNYLSWPLKVPRVSIFSNHRHIYCNLVKSIVNQ